MALIGLTGAVRSLPDPPDSVRAIAPCQIPPLRLLTTLSVTSQDASTAGKYNDRADRH
jgi:hypothetical protein